MADTSTSPVGPTRSKRRLKAVLSVVVTTLVAVALLIALLLGTILRNDAPASSHGGMGSGPLVQTTSTSSPVLAETSVAPPTTMPLSPFKRAVAEKRYLAVESTVDKLEVCDAPGEQPKVTFTYGRTNRFGQPMVFLVADETKDAEGYTWYQVFLPEKPNGVKGWLRASQVKTTDITHDVRIYLADHRLDLYEYGQKVKSYQIGVGKVETPSPLGEFYVVEKIVPENTAGDYGVMAMGTTAFSETIQNWPGRAQVGIHGTNAPETIGQDTTHGCIRLLNDEIMEISQVVHLGTPVFIYE
jgi:lipoprotein-anchoring transpeptidase ErfK/SrfK